jgi:hypothetical protein
MAEANRLPIEKVPLIWLVTAICVVPFAIYYLLSFLSPLIHRLTPMTISEVRKNDGTGWCGADVIVVRYTYIRLNRYEQ